MAEDKWLFEAGNWAELDKRYPQWRRANPGTKAREKRDYSNKGKK
jgi:hypothetical protein